MSTNYNFWNDQHWPLQRVGGSTLSLIENVNVNLLASERESRQSIRDAAADEFEVLVKQIRHLLDEVSDNNRDILRLKDKLVVNVRQDK